MKRILLSIICLVLTLSLAWGQKYLTRTGHIDFYSHTPVEDIKAANDQVSSILDTESGDLVFAALMKAFQFPKALMQEHFNEKYVESDKYPKAQFKGKILSVADVDWGTDGRYPVDVAGTLTMHGITQTVETPATIRIEGGQIKAETTFMIRPSDYEVSVPAVVRESIAEEIEVNVNMVYEPYR